MKLRSFAVDDLKRKELEEVSETIASNTAAIDWIRKSGRETVVILGSFLNFLGSGPMVSPLESPSQ
jgi:hypothetical protein